MALSVSGVIIPLAALPSGKASPPLGPPSSDRAKQVPVKPRNPNPPRVRKCRRVHMACPPCSLIRYPGNLLPAFAYPRGARVRGRSLSILLLPSLLRQCPVVALDGVLVFGHEVLVLEISVHLAAHRLGQMAPDFLVEVRVLVISPAAFVAAPARIVGAALIGHLLLLALALLAALALTASAPLLA